jgi:hypothetical protein
MIIVHQAKEGNLRENRKNQRLQLEMMVVPSESGLPLVATALKLIVLN